MAFQLEPLVFAAFLHTGDMELTLLWSGQALLLVDNTQKAGHGGG